MNRLLAVVERAISKVADPELGGLGIGELGLVYSVRLDEQNDAEVVLLPTFLGCPALAFIANDVQNAALRSGAASCRVIWANAPAWSSVRISATGRTHLAALGIAVATADEPNPQCPSCGHDMLQSVNPVGATACRSVAWCRHCRSVIDVLGTDRAA